MKNSTKSRTNIAKRIQTNKHTHIYIYIFDLSLLYLNKRCELAKRICHPLWIQCQVRANSDSMTKFNERKCGRTRKWTARACKTLASIVNYFFFPCLWNSLGTNKFKTYTHTHTFKCLQNYVRDYSKNRRNTYCHQTKIHFTHLMCFKMQIMINK